MRLRHRTPSIFSMSMLDILCCALGAAILLMLLNVGLAYQRAQAVNVAEKKAADRQGELNAVKTELVSAKGTIQSLASTKDDFQKTLTSMEANNNSLERELKEAKALLQQAEADRKETEKLLANAVVNNKEATTENASLRKQMSKQADKLTDAEGIIPELRKNLDDAIEKGTKANERAMAIEADLLKLRKQMEEAGIKLAAKEKEAQAAIDAASLDKKTLRTLLDEQRSTSGRLRQQLQVASQRFAGVDLTGKRVIFLIDMSGSMAAIDSKTLSPAKWPEVCNTAGQVLKSLPEVEKYQIILFSDEVNYPMGGKDGWLDFDREKTPDAVRDALLKITPKGNTHMYDAFKTAFNFKAQGLDTIFLFSDGLPNIGPGGLAQVRDDEESQAQNAALLGNYLRNTLKKDWNATGIPVRIHAVGFFYESPALGAFLWALTRENGGNFVGMSKP